MEKTFKEQLAESDEPINWWFELSYAQYLTVPRLIMQSMPLEWQQKMAVLLQEMDETFDWRPKEGQYWVRLKDANGRFTDAPLEDYRRGSCEHLRLSNKACSGRVDSSGSPELFPAEVSPSAKVTRQSTRR